MNIILFLKKLKDLGITLSYDNGALDIEGPEEALSQDLIEEITQHKQKIIEYFQNRSANQQINLKKAEKKEYYKASSVQKRFYEIFKFKKDSKNLNLPWVYTIHGDLDIQKLEYVFNQIIQKHEILRTFFRETDGEILQEIASEMEFKISYLEANGQEINSIIQDFIQAFDLNTLPLMRAGVIKIKDNEHILVIDFHHIITDGSSLNIFIEELVQLYSLNTLPGQEWQYKDFSEWQNDYMQSDKIQSKEKYWKNYLQGELPVLDMPVDYQRTLTYETGGEIITRTLEGEWVKQIQKILHKSETTLNMLLLSVFNIILNKWTEQEDMMIGSVSSGRDLAEFNTIMGPFIETVVLRNHPEKEKTFYEFLMEVKTNVINAFDNSPYPFDLILDFENINWQRGRNPVFDVMLIVQNLEKKKIKLDNLEISKYDFKNEVAKVDLTIEATESEDCIMFDAEYKSSLYKKETIERFISHFINLLKEICELSQADEWKEKKIKDFNIISNDEKEEILNSFNKPCIQVLNKKVYEIIGENASENPESTALIENGKQITYREIEERSNQLAHYLIEQYHIKKGNNICIIAEHNAQTIISILAILKTGAVYVPISKDYPIERISYICNDCKPEIFINTGSPIEGLEGIKTLALADKQNEIEEYPQTSPQIQISNEDTAYIIYTSGSTGLSKGVLISHYSFADYVVEFSKYFNVTSNDIVLQQSSLTFDTSIEEIFPVLCKGGKLCLIENGGKDFETITKEVSVNGATIISATPTLISEINKNASEFKNLRVLISGGDELKHKHINNLVNITEVYNTYGPTETTVCASYTRITNINEEISIGKPIVNRQILILDKNNKLMPVGVPGEICIAGTGVAKGYLNHDELTKEKFVELPYYNNTIFYKTGDIGKWKENGEILFLGRNDNQVKIQGCRIETGEIEHNLLKNDLVDEAVVLINENKSGKKELIAYVVLNEGNETTFLREYLLGLLPSYMIPSTIIHLEKLPVNSNGKIDIQYLQKKSQSLERKFILPSDNLEKEILEIWAEVLEIEKDNISMDSDFFELGGHSLKATIIIGKIHKSLNIKLPLEEVIANPSLTGMVKLIKNIKQLISQEIPEDQNNVEILI